MNQDIKKPSKRSVLAKKYRQAIAGDCGDAVLKDLMSRFFFFDSTFNGNVNDVLYKEGQRSVLLYLLHMTDKGYEEIQKLTEENSYERVQHFRELYNK